MNSTCLTLKFHNCHHTTTGEGEEATEEEVKIDETEAPFKGRFSIGVTPPGPDEQWELHTLTIKDAVMEDAGKNFLSK